MRNQAFERRRPSGLKRLKSSKLLVARVALRRMATAAMLQSGRELRRRPDWLKRWAAREASSDWRGSGREEARGDGEVGGGDGSQRNSVQAIQLMLIDSPAAR